MRGYFVTNMYLSQIQRGIQAAHCMHDILVDYPFENPGKRTAEHILWEWAGEHKTMIILNGGTSNDLNLLYETLSSEESPIDSMYPYGCFYEPGIGNALTCVGVVLTDGMVELISLVRTAASTLHMGELVSKFTHDDFNLSIPTLHEVELANRLARLPLA